MRALLHLNIWITLTLFSVLTVPAHGSILGVGGSFRVSVNNEEIPMYFPSSRAVGHRFEAPTDITEASIVRPPWRAKDLKCFFQSQLQRFISPLFTQERSLSNPFDNARYMLCFDTTYVDESVLLFEKTDEEPIIRHIATNRKRALEKIDKKSSAIRRVAIITVPTLRSVCYFQTADGALFTLRLIGQMFETPHDIVEVYCTVV